MLAASAQGHEGSHISFTSFLGIGQAQALHPPGQPEIGTASQPPGEGAAEDPAAEAGQGSSLLVLAASHDRAHRARPVKNKDTDWGTKQQARSALEKLISKPKKSGSSGNERRPHFKDSEAVMNAPREGSDRSDGTCSHLPGSRISRVE